MRGIVGALLIIIVVVGGSLLIVNVVYGNAREKSIDKCRALGTDPEDMIYIRNEHYLCVTKDGRVVGRT